MHAKLTIKWPLYSHQSTSLCLIDSNGSHTLASLRCCDVAKPLLSITCNPNWWSNFRKQNRQAVGDQYSIWYMLEYQPVLLGLQQSFSFFTTLIMTYAVIWKYESIVQNLIPDIYESTPEQYLEWDICASRIWYQFRLCFWVCDEIEIDSTTHTEVASNFYRDSSIKRWLCYRCTSIFMLPICALCYGVCLSTHADMCSPMR